MTPGVTKEVDFGARLRCQRYTLMDLLLKHGAPPLQCQVERRPNAAVSQWRVLLTVLRPEHRTSEFPEYVLRTKGKPTD